MEVAPKKIEIYVARSGKMPFVEWMESLRDSKARAQVKIRLDRMRFGNLGDCKSVGDGVFELRIKFGPGYRVYLGQVGNRVILLLCAGDKSTQFKDIQKAKEYWIDYRSKSHEKSKR